MECINKYKVITDEKLIEYLNIVNLTELREAMEYSVKIGGKRVRPALLLGAYNAVTGSENFESVWAFVTALEFIHTYSLIHDDLPAMDDDDFRRGKPTNHKVFGEATAILSGDALLNTAFEGMTKYCLENFEVKNLKAMKIIAEAAGANGMIKGQVLDMKFENNPNVDIETLKLIHNHKTGDLIRASILAGVVLGGKEELYEDFEKLSVYLGIAFQIQDDILDCIGTFDKLGKPINSDIKNNKTTYVSIYGLDGAKEVYNKYKLEILALTEKLDIKNTDLEKIIFEILDREC